MLLAVRFLFYLAQSQGVAKGVPEQVVALHGSLHSRKAPGDVTMPMGEKRKTVDVALAHAALLHVSSCSGLVRPSFQGCRP